MIDRPECGCCDSDVALAEAQSKLVPVEPDEDVPGFDNWDVFGDEAT